MKTKDWQTVALGDVLTHRKQFIEIDNLQEYKRCKVQVHVRGIVLRDTVKGFDIKTKKQQVCQAGEFLVAEIDAKMGGFGIVPQELQNAVVSSHYFLFGIDESKVEKRFFEFFIRTPFFCDQVSAQGSTNYAAIRPSQVLAYQIPIPSLTEQRRIVARIEELAAKVEEAKRLRQEIVEDNYKMLLGVFHKIIENAEYKTMAEIAPIFRRQIEIDINAEYEELGVRGFGNGIFHKPILKGIDLTWQKLFQIKKDDLVISNIKAWEGAIAVAGEKDHDRVASHRYITCVPQQEILATFLCFYLLSSEGIEKVQAASLGSADRNQTLAVKRLEKITVPVPAIEKQRWFDSLLQKTNAIKKHQAETEQQLNALMPAILDKAFKGEL
jgi:type I restriction enzyme S subunit